MAEPYCSSDSCSAVAHLLARLPEKQIKRQVPSKITEIERQGLNAPRAGAKHREPCFFVRGPPGARWAQEGPGRPPAVAGAGSPWSAGELPRTEPAEKHLQMRGEHMAGPALCSHKMQHGGRREETNRSLRAGPSGSVWLGAVLQINVSNAATSGSNWMFSSSWSMWRGSLHKHRPGEATTDTLSTPPPIAGMWVLLCTA